ncbi:NAD-dependent epimerase/dehydratase family protein [Actinocorallia aurea]
MRADLEKAAGAGPFDLVVDPSGYLPEEVRLVADVFGAVSPRLLFVSTVDAYDGWPEYPVSESSPLHSPVADVENSPYGHRKAACELLLRQVWPGDLLVVRPGVILGPREPKGRLPWWLRRVARGGSVLGPGDPERPIQPVDVDDVAAFVVRLAESSWAGAVNVAAPPGHTTMGRLLAACAHRTGGDVDFRWVADEALVAAGVRDWTELPMWRPAAGTWQVSVDLALSLGLRLRPVEETVRRTWEWLRAGGEVAAHWRTAEHGIDPVKEAALIPRW